MQPGLVKWIFASGFFRIPLTAAAVVKLVVEMTAIVLKGLEIRQDLIIRPALQAHGGPIVVVLTLTANIHHAVNSGGAAHHPASGPGDTSPVQRGLSFGLVTPVERGQIIKQTGRHRHFNQRIPVAASRFQQQHPFGRVSRKPIGQQATRRARSDNNVIRCFTHRFLATVNWAMQQDPELLPCRFSESPIRGAWGSLPAG